MKNTIKASILASAILALASAAANAGPITVGIQTSSAGSTTIGISATIASFDSISCNPSIDFNQYMPITNSGLGLTQQISCQYASNDASPMDVTVYLPNGSPLTGLSGATIPNSNIFGGATPNMTPFQPLTGNLAGNDGLVVATAIEPSSGSNLIFYLALNVPSGTLADRYNATLTVAITPELSVVNNQLSHRRI